MGADLLRVPLPRRAPAGITAGQRMHRALLKSEPILLGFQSHPYVRLLEVLECRLPGGVESGVAGVSVDLARAASAGGGSSTAGAMSGGAGTRAGAPGTAPARGTAPSEPCFLAYRLRRRRNAQAPTEPMAPAP